MNSETLLSTDTQTTLSLLYAEHYPRLARWCESRCAGHGDDLAQDVWVKILAGYDRYEDRGLPFAAFMFKVAHSTLIDWRRKKKNSALGWSIDAGEVHENWLPHRHPQGTALELMCVDEALERVPESQRTALLLQANGYKDHEVAASLGLGALSLKALRWRAREALGAVAKDSGEGAAGQCAAMVEQSDLSTLSPRERQVVTMIYGEGRTRKDVADRLGLGEGTVNNVRKLGLRKLRAMKGSAA